MTAQEAKELAIEAHQKEVTKQAQRDAKKVTEILENIKDFIRVRSNYEQVITSLELKEKLTPGVITALEEKDFKISVGSTRDAHGTYVATTISW